MYRRRHRSLQSGHAVWRDRHRKKMGRWIVGSVGVVVVLLIVLCGYAYNNYRSAANNSYYPTQRQYQRDPQRQIRAKGALSILFLGTNAKQLGMSHQGTTATMIVMTLNPQTHRTTMTSLPKNARTSYNGHTMMLDRLYNAGGIPAVTKNVQKMLRIPVDYYVLSDAKGLANTAKQVGGVNVTPTQTFTSDGVKFQTGKTQLMNKKRVLAYLKTHGSGEQADSQRQMRNKQILLALFNKIARSPFNANAANSLSDDIHTDLSFNDLERLVLHYRGAAQNKQHVSLGNGVMSRIKNDPRFQRLSPQQKQKAISVIRQNLGM